MSDAAELPEQPCGLSRAECQEQLLKLRELVTPAASRLYDTSRAYYYLCDVVQSAPAGLDDQLEPLVAEKGQDYLASWEDLIVIATKAKTLLGQMARMADVDTQLRELEKDAIGAVNDFVRDAADRVVKESQGGSKGGA